MERIRKRPVVLVVLVVALFAVGCVGFGVDEYREFKGAVDSGASCEQLFHIAAGFNGETRDRIDEDLNEIGCTDRNAQRDDR